MFGPPCVDLQSRNKKKRKKKKEKMIFFLAVSVCEGEEDGVSQ